MSCSRQIGCGRGKQGKTVLAIDRMGILLVVKTLNNNVFCAHLSWQRHYRVWLEIRACVKIAYNLKFLLKEKYEGKLNSNNVVLRRNFEVSQMSVTNQHSILFWSTAGLKKKGKHFCIVHIICPTPLFPYCAQ